jgi:hypothetical protein
VVPSASVSASFRHAMRRVGVEVDARDVRADGRSELVALVEEVRAVVVLRICSVLPLDDEVTLPDKLSPQWRETTVAQGSTALENPSALSSWYGYYNDGPLIPAPGDVQAKGHNVEATKSEPDKNTLMPAVFVLAEPASVIAGPFANVVAPSTATAPSATTIPAIRILCTDTKRSLPGWTCGTGQRLAPARSLSP